MAEVEVERELESIVDKFGHLQKNAPPSSVLNKWCGPYVHPLQFASLFLSRRTEVITKLLQT